MTLKVHSVCEQATYASVPSVEIELDTSVMQRDEPDSVRIQQN